MLVALAVDRSIQIITADVGDACCVLCSDRRDTIGIPKVDSAGDLRLVDVEDGEERDGSQSYRQLNRKSYWLNHRINIKFKH